MAAPSLRKHKLHAVSYDRVHLHYRIITLNLVLVQHRKPLPAIELMQFNSFNNNRRGFYITCTADINIAKHLHRPPHLQGRYSSLVVTEGWTRSRPIGIRKLPSNLHLLTAWVQFDAYANFVPNWNGRLVAVIDRRVARFLFGFTPITEIQLTEFLPP